ncbi:plasma membrane calcium-transporting ATPase [Stipitochalara longipes BDJ]|nr:plasma membrane calcium-transporting ATPase [Stipitochalara longipes BDJ]
MKKDAFAFTAEQLSTLHSPKNPAAFVEFKGVEGLITGLRSDRTRGIGAQKDITTSPALNKEISNSPTNLRDAEEGLAAPRTRLSFTATITTTRLERNKDPNDPALLAQRKAIFSDNRLPTKKELTLLARAWSAYNDPVLFLLTVAAIISLAIGLYQTFDTPRTPGNPPIQWVEGVAIIIAIVIIVLVSTINDWAKSREFKKLNEKQLERDAKVIRFGSSTLLSGSDILVGDVVKLEPGDVVPADGILLDGYNVSCDESSATGESDLVHKTPGDAVYRQLTEGGEENVDSSLPKLDPFLLSGTKVLEGVGTFLVTATGTNSTYGKILAQVSEADDPETPLQSRLAVMAKYISWIGGVVSLLFFLGLFIRFLAELPHDHSSPTNKGKNFVDIVIIALTVLVIAVPEGLPLAVTLSLAFATTRMLKDHNLVRQLKSCEVAGNATSILSDKTGTLTQNKMTVVAGMVGSTYNFSDKSDASTTPVISPSSPNENLSSTDFVHGLSPGTQKALLQSIALNTTAFDSKDGFSFVGSNTESALLGFARDHLEMGPLTEERAKENVLQLIPFNGVYKCMATIIELKTSPGTCRVFIKGAAEILLSKCSRIIHDPTTDSSDLETIEISTDDRERMTATIEKYASRPLRTISLAYRDLPLSTEDNKEKTGKTNFSLDYLLADLVFLGVMGIQDPLRPEVWQAVKDCKMAGVTVRMVTGDNLLTANAIARECGILLDGDYSYEGAEFRALSDSMKRKIVPDLRVLARSTPEDKRQLVLLLKELDEIVAVTGDGTNDAAAMSAADVSFAMGLTGTDVARQASSIILLTDNFASIVKAIMWGRAVNDSVKKFLQYQIAITVTSVALVFVSGISNSNEESVLTPVQLMWINLFQDTLAALALATDPPSKRVLERKPEPRMAPLITITMWKTIITQSIYQTAVTLVLYFAGNKMFSYSTEEISTLVFNAYVWMQIFNMYNCRQYDDTFNVFEGVFKNWLFMSVSSIIIGLQIMIIFVGGQAFHVVPLTGPQWAISLVLGLLTLAVGAATRCLPNWSFSRTHL